MFCRFEQKWVVLVEEWEVGGGTVVMVAILPENSVCSDSYVHFTKIKVILVNESDVTTNHGSEKV